MDVLIIIIVGVSFALFIFFMYSAAIGSFFQDKEDNSRQLKPRNLIIGAILMFFIIMLINMCTS